MDSEIIESSEIRAPPPPLTQTVSKNVYAWVILFKNDINELNPFRLEKLKTFLNSNFPWKLVQGEMTKELRKKVHQFSCFPGEEFYIFAKIQHGTYAIKIVCYCFCYGFYFATRPIFLVDENGTCYFLVDRNDTFYDRVIDILLPRPIFQVYLWSTEMLLSTIVTLLYCFKYVF